MSLESSKLYNDLSGDIDAPSTKSFDLEKFLSCSLNGKSFTMDINELAITNESMPEFLENERSQFRENQELLNYLNVISNSNRILSDDCIQKLHAYLAMLNKFNDQFDPDLQQNLRDRLNEQQIRSTIKHELEAEKKAFEKQIMDAIENEILEAQYLFKSMDYYRECLKYMLSHFEKGSMMFMSTMAMLDGVTAALPNIASNIHSLNSNKMYISDQIKRT